jgi:hypothetical protein
VGDVLVQRLEAVERVRLILDTATQDLEQPPMRPPRLGLLRPQPPPEGLAPQRVGAQLNLARRAGGR